MDHLVPRMTRSTIADTTRRALVRAVIVALLPLALRAQTPAALGPRAGVDDRASALHGRFVVTPASRASMPAAVERAVAPMSFIVRPVARGRLLALNAVAPSVTFRLGRDSVVLEYEGQPRLAASRTGGDVAWRNARGDDMRASVVAPLAAASGTPLLEERYVTRDGIRTNRWTVDAEGSAVMNAVVEGPRLAAPMSFRLTYRALTSASGAP
jgi:hypothetical protein